MTQPERSRRPPEAAPDLPALFKALADEQRIKILAQVIDAPRTPDEIAGAIGLDLCAAGQQLAQLEYLGLVRREEGGRYRFSRAPILSVLRDLSQRSPGIEIDPSLPEYDRKVLATFFQDGRLTQIPMQQKKRDVILRYLASQFEAERMYHEREVNEIIRPFHDDTASLRRYLVDGDLLKRQVVRVVEMESLVEGDPSVDLQVTYWKPRPDADSHLP
jgi:hypothetical protein